MAWTNPTVTSVLFKAIISPGTVPPMVETIPFVLPLTFSAVANVNVYRGIYTPNNDYLYIFQGIPLAIAPNFIIVLTGPQLNLAKVFSTTGMHMDSLTRFGFNSWMLDSSNFLTSLFLEGRTANVPIPMPQGSPIEYVIITGQASIT